MNRTAGFTLLELVIVLVIAAVLVTVAAPGFRGFIGGQELKNVTQSLYMDLLYARSEAIKRNANVNVAPNDGDWDGGWLVTAAGATEVDCGASSFDVNVLRAGCAIVNAGVAFQSDPGGAITYAGNGRANASATFVLCDADNRQARRVRIGVDGLPQIARLDSCP
jgi:type IV fimbrial biogenesis protein FimT